MTEHAHAHTWLMLCSLESHDTSLKYIYVGVDTLYCGLLSLCRSWNQIFSWSLQVVILISLWLNLGDYALQVSLPTRVRKHKGCIIVYFTLDPLSCKAVNHQAAAETLEPGILEFIQPLTIGTNRLWFSNTKKFKTLCILSHATE